MHYVVIRYACYCFLKNDTNLSCVDKEMVSGGFLLIK